MSGRNRASFDINLESIRTKWQRVGAEEGLTSDAQIASFLIQQYEADTPERKSVCSVCHAPLNLYCRRCKTLVNVTEHKHQSGAPTVSQETSKQGKDAESCVKESSLPVLKAESQTAYCKSEESDLSSLLLQFSSSSPSSFTFVGSKDPGNWNDDNDENVEVRFNDPCKNCDVRQKNDRIPKHIHHKNTPMPSSENLSDKMLIKADLPSWEIENAVNTVRKQELFSVFDQTVRKTNCDFGNGIDVVNIKLEPVVDLGADLPNFPSRKRRKRKENRQTDGPKSSCMCIVCGSSFPDRKTMREHKLSEHPGDRPFRCSVCCSAFRKKRNLNCHMLTHTKEKPLLCTVCGKGFGYENSLKIHMRTHTEEKPYACKLCDYTGISASSLRRHELSHTSDRPYICEVCCKGFKSLCALKRHRLRHTEVRPYPCDICGVKFKTKDEVREHQTAVHRTGRAASKTLSCPECDFTTHLQNRLKQHLVTHSEERPFKCDLCPKSFRRKSHFDRHQQCHRGKTAYVCSVCNASYSREDNLTAHLKKHVQTQNVIKMDVKSL